MTDRSTAETLHRRGSAVRAHARVSSRPPRTGPGCRATVRGHWPRAGSGHAAVVAVLICAGSFATGCKQDTTAQQVDLRMAELNANLTAYNRFVRASNDFSAAWTSYATASGDGRKVEELKRCLSVIQSLDTTTGSESDLGVFRPIGDYKAARIRQVNAYITAHEAGWAADWSLAKQRDEEVRRAEESVGAVMKTIEDRKAALWTLKGRVESTRRNVSWVLIAGGCVVGLMALAFVWDMWDAWKRRGRGPGA